MNNPPQPTTLSPAFRLIIGGALFICAAIFVLALHKPHRSELANIKETTDGWWMHQNMPTPAPTPPAAPVSRPHPVLVVQTPPKVAPKPMATPKPVSEFELRYRRAIETGFGSDASNVRQLPQLMGPSGVPIHRPTPNIFALGAYPQP